MSKLKKEVYRVLKDEYVTIVIKKSIKDLIVKEMKKYIEALDVEFELGESREIFEQISLAQDLLIRIILTSRHENVEMTIHEFLFFESFLYCSITAMESFKELNYEYSQFYKSIQEIYQMLDESYSAEYKM